MGENMSMFKKAVKAESKLRLVVAGPSGSGKTYTGLAIASALADGAPIAVVDTEHGSASKYADLFNFDVAEMHPPFHPDKFVQAIQDAAAAGYAVIILDSLTHAWSGTGGMLDLIDEIAKRKTSGNSFAAWKDGTPIQNRLIDAIVSAPIHVIATIRSKQDYVQDKDDRGKTVVRKVGMAAQQREGFEYEFDVAFDMDIDNNAIVSKTRCPALTGRVFSKPGRDVASILAEWLRGEPAPQPPTRQEVTTTTTPAGAAAATNGTATGNASANGNGGTNGHGGAVVPSAPVNGSGWGNWTTQADFPKAYQWAQESGKFAADKHLSAAWSKHMQAWRGKPADEMLAAWHEYVCKHDAAKPADVPAMADVEEQVPA